MSPFHIFYLIVVSLVIASCTSPNNEYITAKSLDPIKVPEVFETERLGELYPVPEGSTEQIQTSTPLPPTVGVQSAVAATAYALGERLWILNNKAPATTWSQLLEFWQEQEVAVISQNVTSATMQTAWFTEAIQPGFEVRYQLVLTRGLQYDSTEITLLNQVRKQGNEVTAWGDTSDNSNHSQWLIERLEGFLNSRPGAFNNSFLASQLNLPSRVSYKEQGEKPILTVNVESDRTVSMLTRALEQSPMYLYAADVSRNVYHINVIEPNQNNGLLSRLNPFSSQEPIASPYALPEIIESIEKNARGEKASKLNDVPGYLVVVTDSTGNQQQITLRNGYGQLLPIDEARLVIDMLRRQLR